MVYLDYNATTPTDKRVVEVMQPFFSQVFGNPASDHISGLHAKQAVDQSRQEIADFIGAKPDEIIFTSCATESNNLALIGSALKNKETKNHIITTKIEHPSIFNPCQYLESIGFEVTYLGVDEYGFVDLEELKNSITDKTLLVSIIFANNEIGTIQPIKEIGEITREKGTLLHVDAAQAVGHILINVDKLNIDLMSVSAHKFYGPKGIGILFMRGRVPRVKLSPLVYGGGQERNIRPGTLNVPYIVGMAEACKIAKKEMKFNNEYFKKLTDKIFNGLKEVRSDIKLNGHLENRLVHNLNIEIPGIDNKWLTLKMKDFCFATGSACSEFHDKPSHVLQAIGLDDEQINSCIRVSIGADTTEGDVDRLIEEMSKYISNQVCVKA